MMNNSLSTHYKALIIAKGADLIDSGINPEKPVGTNAFGYTPAKAKDPENKTYYYIYPQGSEAEKQTLQKIGKRAHKHYYENFSINTAINLARLYHAMYKI